MARHYRIQLHDHRTGAIIQATGGTCYVTKDGSPDKEALTDKGGASVSNPSALTSGLIEFHVADTVAKVDLFIMAPNGQFVVFKGVVPSGPNEIFIDEGIREQVAVIPFSQADQAGDNTETDSGIDLPKDALVGPDGAGIFVQDLDAGETIDVGLLASEAGGDANGFMALVSVATALAVAAASVVTVGGTETYFSSTTLGVLLVDFLAGADALTDVGSNNPKRHRGDGVAQSISWTLSTGADTAAGFIILPYRLFKV